MESFGVYLNNQTQPLLFPRQDRCVRWQTVAFKYNFYFYPNSKKKKILSIPPNMPFLICRHMRMKVSLSYIRPPPSNFLSFSCRCCRHCHLFVVIVARSTEILNKNLHECLQCPPHWNSWGKVSSLAFNQTQRSQLEPLCLEDRLFFFFFSPPTESRGQIGTTLHWFSGCLNIYGRIMVWISHGVFVCCRCFQLSKFLWLRRLLGRGGERWNSGGGTVDGFFFTLHSDQSFLNTPERHDSRIGTHPVKKEERCIRRESQQDFNYFSSKLIMEHYLADCVFTVREEIRLCFRLLTVYN